MCLCGVGIACVVHALMGDSHLVVGIVALGVGFECSLDIENDFYFVLGAGVVIAPHYLLDFGPCAVVMVEVEVR